MHTSLAERNALIEEHLPYVREVARRLAGCLPAHGPRADELLSAGVLGLIDAIDDFDPERGNLLRTFAAKRIRGAMLDEIRRLDLAGRTFRRRERTIRETAQALASELGRRPAADEIAEALGLDSRSVWETHMRCTAPQSLQRRDFETDSGREVRVVDEITDERAERPDARLERADRLALILRRLNRIERQVVMLYYVDELTMAEIGQVLGLSESRVSQLHSAVVEFVRDRLRGQRGEI